MMFEGLGGAMNQLLGGSFGAQPDSYQLYIHRLTLQQRQDGMAAFQREILRRRQQEYADRNDPNIIDAEFTVVEEPKLLEHK